MTIDGKIASRDGDSELSDEEDWKDVHELRTQVDAILVGKGTIINDDPKLHIKFFPHEGYYRVVLDSNLSIPINAKVITYQCERYPTIMCTTEKVPNERVREFENLKIKVIKSGKGNRVDIVNLMPKLFQLGIKKILLEGGGTLNWSFFKEGLIDEIRLAIAPWIIGGQTAISLVEGEGFRIMSEGPRFKLIDIFPRNNYAILIYRRLNNDQ